MERHNVYTIQRRLYLSHLPLDFKCPTHSLPHNSFAISLQYPIFNKLMIYVGAMFASRSQVLYLWYHKVYEFSKLTYLSCRSSLKLVCSSCNLKEVLTLKSREVPPVPTGDVKQIHVAFLTTWVSFPKLNPENFHRDIISCFISSFLPFFVVCIWSWCSAIKCVWEMLI